MLRTLAIVLLLLAGAAQAAGTDQELRTLEELRREAIKTKDFATLERIYAPGFVGITGTGQVITRTELFRVFAGTDPTLAFATDEVRVLEHGDTAVFVGRLVARNASGKVAFASRFSHTFIRHEGRWVCISGQSTPVKVE